jgi:hypothetical protein
LFASVISESDWLLAATTDATAAIESKEVVEVPGPSIRIATTAAQARRRKHANLCRHRLKLSFAPDAGNP